MDKKVSSFEEILEDVRAQSPELDEDEANERAREWWQMEKDGYLSYALVGSEYWNVIDRYIQAEVRVKTEELISAGKEEVPALQGRIKGLLDMREYFIRTYEGYEKEEGNV